MLIIKLKRFFAEITSVPQQDSVALEQKIILASAALFIEMMRQDGFLKKDEKSQILKILQTQFKLNNEKSLALYQLAEDEIKSATDYHQFTQFIAEEFDQPQKIQLIENLWRVAFADNLLDKYEENMVRKIADLIHVSHKDFIQAKFRVQQSLA